LNYVEENFENGFVKSSRHTSTPRVRFEALSVGVNLALQINPNIANESINWLDSDEFTEQVTGGSTNTKSRVKSRIEYVRDRLLGK
jgi:hypothetical protein